MLVTVRLCLCLFVLAASIESAEGAEPVSTSAPTLQLEMIPQPRQVQSTDTGFAPATATRIRVSDTTEDRFAAALLRDALRETSGIDCDLTSITPGGPDIHQLTLTALADGNTSFPPVPASQEKEGYALRVSANGVAINAKTETGLFYGVQTLIQLIEQSGRAKSAIPGMVIGDWPSFGIRARYFDASQYMGTVVITRANLEREIKTLARFKLNAIVMDLYNLVPFKSFPYCADANTLSIGDWQYLVELAHRYHVTLIPSLQSFAQIALVIWNCEEGKPYREETAGGLICPSRPENIKFLQGLYVDLMMVFKYTPVLGIGCSEVGMQWQEHYCPRCRKRLDSGETLHDIYFKHVKACAQAVDAAAKQLGRAVRPLMWADEFYMGYEAGKRWIGIENIPKNVVMGHWEYWSRYLAIPDQKTNDYDGIVGLLERGFDVFFLTASFEFNTYLHDLTPADPKDGKTWFLYDAGIINVVEHTRWAYAHNQRGLPGKMLGGGCATFSQHDVRGWDSTWYAFALEGEYTWGDPTRPLADVIEKFTDCFAATFYQARDADAAKTIASAYRELDAAKSDLERNNYLIRDFIGEYDIHDEAYVNNDLVKSLALIDDVVAHPKRPGKTAADIRTRAENVQRTAKSYQPRLAALTKHVGNTYSLGYLVTAAHKIENHAARTLYMLDQQAILHSPASAPADGNRAPFLKQIDELAIRLDALRRDTQFITDEMDQIAFGPVAQLTWAGIEADKRSVNLSGDTAGYHKVLAGLTAFEKQLQVARNTK